jgi:methionyl-tRNA formyltransferase
MRIVFIGTVEFSYKALEEILRCNGDIVGVCTKEKSEFNADYSNLVPLCKDNNIPYKYIEDINSQENIEWIKSLKPDIIFCFGWSSLIKKELLNLAPMGVVGFHPASLPQNRGRHPIIWALALGLKESASTFFFMDEGADSGDILSQVSFDIFDNDNASTIYKKIINIALIQIKEFLPKLQNNSFTKIKQDHSQANIWRKRNKKDGIIDFRMSSLAIYNLIRSLSKPYIGANLVYNEKDIIIWSSKIVENTMNNIESGKILEVKDNTIVVKTYDGAIMLIEHEFSILPKVGEYL